MSKNLWHYDEKGQCVVNDARSLRQPLIHMLANCPKYFSIADNFLRGFSGFDYTRMFGEFDGPNFLRVMQDFYGLGKEKKHGL